MTLAASLSPRIGAPAPRACRRTLAVALAAAGLTLAGCTSGGSAPDAQPTGSAGSAVPTPGTPAPVAAPAGPEPGTGAPVPGGARPSTTRPASGPTGGAPAAPSVDWQNRTYEQDACGPNDSAVPEPAGGYVVRGGATAARAPAPDQPFAVTNVQADIRGDVTGDGREDVVVRIRCSGGTSGTWYAWLYTEEGDTARRLGTVRLPDATATGLGAAATQLRRASVENGRLRSHWALWLDADPNCCPSKRAEVTLVWTGGGWRVEGDPVLSDPTGD